MVQPLTDLTIIPHPFGAQLDVYWALPSELPSNYKVIVFKRAHEDVDDTEDIGRYFTDGLPTNLLNYDYKKCFVTDNIPIEITALADMFTGDGITYYYKAVIYDKDTNEYSTPKAANAIPNCEIVSEIQSGKEIVMKAIKAMFTTFKDNNEVIKAAKDIDYRTYFPLEAIEKDTVMLQTVNGNTEESYWGDIYYQDKNSIAVGDIDVEVIRATFMTAAHPDRRERFRKILRSRKMFLKQFVKRLSAQDCKVIIEGDYFNPKYQGQNAIGISVIFVVTLTNISVVKDEYYPHIIDQLIIEN